MSSVRTLMRGARLRPVAASPLRQTQIRTAVFAEQRSNDRLGGPGGQQAPGKKPSGVDALRRNWIPIVGGLAILFGTVSLLGKRSERARQDNTKLIPAAKTENIPSASGLAKQLEDKEASALSELSGRKGGGGMGGFRAE